MWSGKSPERHAPTWTTMSRPALGGERPVRTSGTSTDTSLTPWFTLTVFMFCHFTRVMILCAHNRERRIREGQWQLLSCLR